MPKCLNVFGFSSSLIEGIETFYTNIYSCVLNNGSCSFRYAATQVWNMLPDDIRTSESLIAFKRAIQDITV